MLPDEKAHGLGIPRESDREKIKNAGDLGLRSSGIQKTLKAESATSTVPPSCSIKFLRYVCLFLSETASEIVGLLSFKPKIVK